jgi:AcrR family transcriptional regulator
VQNTVPVAEALADKAVAGRRESYVDEVRRLIDAAFEVMQRTGDIDPSVRDIVRTAGLSNQAFYRHFASKDALLLAVLADGQRQLLDTLRRRVEAKSDPHDQLRAWIDGVMAQARNQPAADATRPFAINGARLADRFPTDLARGRDDLIDTLDPTVHALGGNRQAASFIADLVLARMNDAIAHRRKPDRGEINELVSFCLAGVTAHGA